MLEQDRSADDIVESMRSIVVFDVSAFGDSGDEGNARIRGAELIAMDASLIGEVDRLGTRSSTDAASTTSVCSFQASQCAKVTV